MREHSIWETRASSVSADSSLPVEYPYQDRYHYDEYADAIAGCVLNAADDEPLTISIEGGWGSGKTSLVNLLDYKFQHRHAGVGYKVAVFDAWTRDQDERGVGEFYRWLLQRAYAERGPVESIIDPLPDSLVSEDERRRRSYRRFMGVAALVAGGLAWTLNGQAIQPVLVGIAVLLAIFGLTPLMLWEIVRGSLRFLGVEGFYGLGRGNSPDDVTSRERLAERAIAALGRMPESSSTRLVVVVDNLDRCRPRTAVEILEAIDQLTQELPLIVILPADFATLAAQLEDEYTRRHGTQMAGLENFGSRFLERLVTMPFQLPERPLSDPFVRAARKHDDDASTSERFELTGRFGEDLQRKLRAQPSPLPASYGDVLRSKDSGPRPGLRPKGFLDGGRSRLALFAARVAGSGAAVFAAVASQDYPAAKRPSWIGDLPLPRWFRALHAVTCMPLVAAFAWIAIGVSACVLGLTVAVVESVTLWAGVEFGNATSTFLVDFAGRAFLVCYVLLIFGGMLCVVVSSVWASEIRSRDWKCIQSAINAGPSWEPVSGNRRVSEMRQKELRYTFAAVRADPQLWGAQGIPALSLIQTERGRKRVANRARLLAKIAERRPHLRSLPPEAIVTWAIAQENGLDRKPPSADELAALQKSDPNFEIHANELRSLGLGFDVEQREIKHAG